MIFLNFLISAQVRLSAQSEQTATQKLLYFNKCLRRLIGDLRYIKYTLIQGRLYSRKIDRNAPETKNFKRFQFQKRV